MNCEIKKILVNGILFDYWKSSMRVHSLLFAAFFNLGALQTVNEIILS